MTKKEEILALRKACQDRVKEIGKAIVTEEIETIFAAHPELKAIRWTQYTPYFNDGDVCEFGLHEVSFKTESTPEDAGDYEDGFDNLPWRDEQKTPLTKALQKFEDERDEELYEEAFGDHCQITATREGVEIAQYDHY